MLLTAGPYRTASRTTTVAATVSARVCTRRWVSCGFDMSVTTVTHIMSIDKQICVRPGQTSAEAETLEVNNIGLGLRPIHLEQKPCYVLKTVSPHILMVSFLFTLILFKNLSYNK